MHRPGKVLPKLDDFVKPIDDLSKTRFTKIVRNFYLAGKLKQKKVYYSKPESHSLEVERRSQAKPEKEYVS